MSHEAKSHSSFIDEQVRAVKPLLPVYDRFCELLLTALKSATEELGYSVILQGRTKEIRSFAEKCVRKRGKYQQPAHTFTDLCGVRVIVESKDQVEPVCRFIKTRFEIDEANSEDVAVRLHAQEFGYQSHHYIVSAKPDTSYGGLGKLPHYDELLARRGGDEAEREGLPSGPKYKAEIQVRTLLQHAWAAIIHDNLYKTEIKEKPRHLERESGKIASLLEDADDSFVRLLDGVGEYRSSYGTYMSPLEISNEISVLKSVQRHDEENEKLAHEIACLAIAIDDWQMAKEALWPFRGSTTPAIMRDLGWVLWRLDEKELGRNMLRNATNSETGNPDDPDGWCAMGDIAFEDREYRVALQHYSRAFEANSTYPRAIGSYLKCEIVESRGFEFLPLMAPNLARAIELSLQKAQHGIHLPWAWYDIGFFQLLLGNQYESLAAYGMAVRLSASEAPIDDTLDLLDRIQSISCKSAPDRAETIRAVRWFLAVAAVAKIRQIRDDAIARRSLLEQESKMTLGRGSEISSKESAELQTICVTVADLEKRHDEAVDKYLNHRDLRVDGTEKLASSLEAQERFHFDTGAPVVIVAGGCDAGVQARIAEYRHLIENAFADYAGTIISGGTTAGIPGLVGDLANRNKQFRRIAYLPANIPNEDGRHEGYESFRTTRGLVYGPLDAIQVWCDLLDAGVDPGTVCLLGINGGDLSMFEYQLALVVGAQVGILSQSGRSATKLAESSDWLECSNLLLMPTDEETVRAFVSPANGTEMISSTLREEMAVQIHDNYRNNRHKKYLGQYPEMADWARLSSSLKNANYGQVDHLEAVLYRAGFTVFPAEPGAKTEDLSADPAKLESMAEMEHGRWTAERLIDGWRFGGAKDEAKKISPYLVAWRDLPDEIKEYDREAIVALPGVLAANGLAIKPRV